MLVSLFFHSGDVLRVVVLGVTVLGRPDAQEKLEGVAEVIAIVAIERIGAVVDGYLGAESDVDTFAVRQVAEATDRVTAHRKDARVGCLSKTSSAVTTTSNVCTTVGLARSIRAKPSTMFNAAMAGRHIQRYVRRQTLLRKNLIQPWTNACLVHRS